MSDVRVSWGLPTVGSRQRPISHVVVSKRVVGIDEWTVLNEVLASEEQSLLDENVQPGEWEYSAYAVDDLGVEGPASQDIISVDFDPPGELQSFNLGVIE